MTSFNKTLTFSGESSAIDMQEWRSSLFLLVSSDGAVMIEGLILRFYSIVSQMDWLSSNTSKSKVRLNIHKLFISCLLKNLSHSKAIFPCNRCFAPDRSLIAGCTLFRNPKFLPMKRCGHLWAAGSRQRWWRTMMKAYSGYSPQITRCSWSPPALNMSHKETVTWPKLEASLTQKDMALARPLVSLRQMSWFTGIS